jgi:hypothetical protein
MLELCITLLDVERCATEVLRHSFFLLFGFLDVSSDLNELFVLLKRTPSNIIVLVSKFE